MAEESTATECNGTRTVGFAGSLRDDTRDVIVSRKEHRPFKHPTVFGSPLCHVSCHLSVPQGQAPGSRFIPGVG